MQKSDLNLSKNYRLRQSPLFLIFRVIGLELLFAGVFFLLGYLFLEEGVAAYPLLFFVFWAANIILLLSIFIHWYFVYYIISTDALSKHKGFLFKRLKTYDLQSIRSVRVYQGVMGRLFGFGDIVMESPLLHEMIHLKKVQNPLKHAKIIDRQRLRILEDKDLSNITPVI